jgi:23S rRNA pseudouridine1911/1915/1917 synthase
MKEHSFEVTQRDIGRIDKWLVKKLHLSRKGVKNLLDNGYVQVNRRRVLIAGWELEEGDHVLVRIPKRAPAHTHVEEQPEKIPQRPTRETPLPKRRGGERRSALRNIGKPTLLYREEQSLARLRAERGPAEKSSRLKVYYEDKHIIVVEKPAGILSVPQEGSNAPNLVSMVLSYMKRKHPRSKGSYIKALHRLDSDTSGIVVLAKSKEGEKLSRQFQAHSILRKYLAVVHGLVEDHRGVIDSPLEKGRFGRGRKVRLAKSGSGKSAKTMFEVRERYKNATLLDVEVATGRTHQIRVHLASKGFPLIGDHIYGDARAKKIQSKRHALHAHHLGFKHPVTGKKMSFRSPLPQDMKDLIDSLRTG